jgi:hypothetical protein
MTEKDILQIIKEDKWMMNILYAAQSLNFPDWMIGAGFVRNKVWDYLHGLNYKEVQTRDIDLIYFDKEGNNEEEDITLSKKLTQQTGFTWEVVNQVYSHEWHKRAPYKNTTEALADWVETATCVAVSLDENNNLKLHAPHGIDDLVNLTVRCNESCSDSTSYKKRIESKRWKEKWPKLKILY